MFYKCIFVLTSLYVVNASVVTVNVFDDVPETNVEHKQEDCNFRACDQLCRRLGFTGGVCVNGRCKCDNFLSTGDKVSATAETLSSAEKVKDCNFRACDQLCRRLGFTSGVCVNGRCKCDNFFYAEGVISGNANTFSNSDETDSLRACSPQECNQRCRRIGFTGGACVNGRCKCDILRKVDHPSTITDMTNDDVGESYLVLKTDEEELDLPSRGACNSVTCNDLCRVLNYAGGVCSGGVCQCY